MNYENSLDYLRTFLTEKGYEVQNLDKKQLTGVGRDWWDMHPECEDEILLELFQ